MKGANLLGGACGERGPWQQHLSDSSGRNRFFGGERAASPAVRVLRSAIIAWKTRAIVRATGSASDGPRKRWLTALGSHG